MAVNQPQHLICRLPQALVESCNFTSAYYIICKTIICTNLSADNHSLWTATKKFKETSSSAPSTRKSKNNWEKTDEEKADLFADYLAQVGIHSTVAQQ